MVKKGYSSSATISWILASGISISALLWYLGFSGFLMVRVTSSTMSYGPALPFSSGSCL